MSTVDDEACKQAGRPSRALWLLRHCAVLCCGVVVIACIGLIARHWNVDVGRMVGGCVKAWKSIESAGKEAQRIAEAVSSRMGAIGAARYSNLVNVVVSLLCGGAILFLGMQ